MVCDAISNGRIQQSNRTAGVSDAVAQRKQRDWSCHHCNRAFKKREHLARHIRSHTKERPFACDFCPKTYGRRDSLIRHARIHARLRRNHLADSDPSILSPPENDTAIASQANAHNNASSIADPPDDPTCFTISMDLSNDENSNGKYTRLAPSGIADHVSQVSPSSLTSSYAQAASLDASLQSNAWEMSTDMDLLNFGSNSHEPFWLLGGAFDLDALNSSISTTASPRLHRAGPINLSQSRIHEATDIIFNSREATGTTSNSFRNEVQSRWHTRPSVDESFPFAPTRLQDQDQVDETYRTGLSSRLAAHPHDNALPSADFLNLCIKLYFAKFQPVFPILHAASFRPSSESALVVLSICSLGSLFVGSASAHARGRAIFMKLNKAILASWEAYVHQGGREALAVAQASTLGQTYGMLSGNPHDILMTESFHGTIIAWARQAGMFSKKDHPQAMTERSLSDNADNLELTWRSWAQKEETIRVVLALHIHDSEFAAIFHHEPLLRHGPDRVSRCCSEQLFAAQTAAQWHSMVVKSNDFQESGIRRTTSEETRSDPFMYAYALLAGEVATVCEVRGSPGSNSKLTDIRRHLLSWHESFSSTIRVPSRDTLCLTILWHEAFMALYVSFDLLERVVGREGISISNEDVQQVCNWVNEMDHKRCLMHAIFIYKRLRALPISAEPAIHIPKALFYAGLVIYCHVKFSSAEITYGDVDVPELRGDTADLPSAALCQPDSGSLYEIADLLRRQGHWGLSRRFGFILEALIDDLADPG